MTKKQKENELRIIEDMAGRSEADNRTAEVLALCEIARQLARLADLYQFELGLDEEPAAESKKTEAASRLRSDMVWSRLKKD